MTQYHTGKGTILSIHVDELHSTAQFLLQEVANLGAPLKLCVQGTW